ncbi:MAG: rRNA pseudouridine synthase [Candidatus Pacebacteria bacterium]|nr:rRNA pseudouridine synthase [Candidatus Paceibacterota bacterium]
MEYPIRINKYLAHKGHCTRRAADELIAAGKVLVNGEVAAVGQKINEGDVVDVRFKPAKQYQYLAYYKPRGVITHSPAEGETDIEARIKKDYGLTGVFPVGRIDKDSEGLIILTNDGRITDRLLHPDNAHEKEYAVWVDKNLTGHFKKHMEEGVDIEGYTTKPAEVHPKQKNSFTITLTEGKKHQIRRMCAALGYQVQRLKRVRIMDIAIKDIKPGQFRKITGEEQKQFLKDLGL